MQKVMIGCVLKTSQWDLTFVWKKKPSSIKKISCLFLKMTTSMTWHTSEFLHTKQLLSKAFFSTIKKVFEDTLKWDTLYIQSVR